MAEMPHVFGLTPAGSVLLPEPTTSRGNCGGCGIPLQEGVRRYRYELCNRCLRIERFVAQSDGVLKKSFKSRKVGK